MLLHSVYQDFDFLAKILCYQNLYAISHDDLLYFIFYFFFQNLPNLNFSLNLLLSFYQQSPPFPKFAIERLFFYDPKKNIDLTEFKNFKVHTHFRSTDKSTCMITLVQKVFFCSKLLVCFLLEVRRFLNYNFKICFETHRPFSLYRTFETDYILGIFFVQFEIT